MANIHPYRAFFYHPSLRNDLHLLISPPYDVISQSQHQELLKRHPHNSVGLCLTDNSGDPQRYTRLKERLKEWKQKKVFETNPTPAFYLIEEIFTVEGVKKQRLGFVGLLEVSPFDRKEVLPHEHTLSGPKVDRLELLKTMGAELSQIFLCYRDQTFCLEKIYDEKKAHPPTLVANEVQGVSRKLWVLDEPEHIKALQELCKTRSLLIADGHHRYETAVAFHQEDQTDRSRFVQCYFTNLDTPGFSILPIHRIFSLPAEWTAETFRSKLAQNFEITEFQAGLDLGRLEDEKQKTNQLKLLCAFSNAPSKAFLISGPKSSKDDAEIFSIHKNIFEGILGWDVTKLSKGIIHYEHETEDFKQTLGQTANGVGLFLPSTDLRLVMDLAARGQRMPQKSTFFFPKLASGWVNYELPNV